ncbi:hypothetical protein [Scytonema millei]|uniref:Uncharacterized protein n=1 Tax=Scytonema millei VB511283 TaxID=1245923 RepID=A0A9X5E857_9CYAN|nr:hypothetical protein [Scytonema millei]NHC36909.1 hypothetical protein [Scytonema millei VB511283]
MNKPLPIVDSMPPWVYESLAAFDGTVKSWLEMTTSLKAEIEDINAQIRIAIEDSRFGHKAIDSEWLSKAWGALRRKRSQLNLLKLWANSYYPGGVNKRNLDEEQGIAKVVPLQKPSQLEDTDQDKLLKSLQRETKWLRRQLAELAEIVFRSDLQLLPEQSDKLIYMLATLKELDRQ